MKTRLLRSALLGATLATLVAGSVLTTTAPASAAELIPGNEINGGDYTVTFNPTTRTGVVDGTSALVWGPGNVKVSTGCPEGYREASRSFIVAPDGTETEVASPRTNKTSALFGLQGSPMDLSGTRASNWSLLTDVTFPTALNRFVITCDATELVPGTTTPIGDSKYFVTYLQVDRATETWTVVDGPGEPTEKTETTTTLATSAVTATSATLTASIAPAEATGTVTFTKDGVAIGSPAAVSSGVASISVSGLSPATAYTFTAEYSGDATHLASTDAADPVTTPAAADQSSSDVGVTVPTADPSVPTGLTISVKPGDVPLTGPSTRTEGETWTATGALGDVTVNDDRRDASAPWSLTGSMSDLTSGTDVIDAANIGWAPAKVSGSGAAGPAVTAGSDGGLSVDRALASGSGSADANVATTVNAAVTLAAPADTKGGSYTGTLTLTLV